MFIYLEVKIQWKKWTTYIYDNNENDDADYPDEDNDNVDMHQKWTIPDDDYDVNVLCAVIKSGRRPSRGLRSLLF